MMRRLPTLLILALFAACGEDPAEPEPEPEPFEVEITREVTSFILNSATRESRCEYTLTARATGGAKGEYGAWLHGTLEWRRNGSVVDTDGLSKTTVLDYWGSDRIRDGDVQKAHRYAEWTETFTLHHTFRYELRSGERRSVDVFVGCGE